MLLALVLGFVLAFVASMPIAGPVAAMVLDRAVHGRSPEARGVAAGAAVSESVYALLAFWGWTAVLVRFPHVVPVTRALGAVLFIVIGAYLAWRGFHPREAVAVPNKGGGWAVGLSVSALNPTLIVTWGTVIAAAHSMLLLRTVPLDALPFAAGVGAGTITWFLVLIALVDRFRDRLRREWVDRVVILLGGLLTLVGLVSGARLLFTTE